MRVDFYQLARDPVEAALPLIARATLAAGERLLVVSADQEQLSRISGELWTRLPESFLAHGKAGGEHDARQPILLSADTGAANGARFLAIADGQWRDCGAGFARTFFFFGDQTLQGARETWRALGKQDGLERHFWKQEGRRWVEAG